jgi:hypothetical protein
MKQVYATYLVHPDTPNPFDTVREFVLQMSPRLTYQIDAIETPRLHELVQVCGKLVPICARP